MTIYFPALKIYVISGMPYIVLKATVLWIKPTGNVMNPYKALFLVIMAISQNALHFLILPNVLDIKRTVLYIYFITAKIKTPFFNYYRFLAPNTIISFGSYKMIFAIMNLCNI